MSAYKVACRRLVGKLCNSCGWHVWAVAPCGTAWCTACLNTVYPLKGG